MTRALPAVLVFLVSFALYAVLVQSQPYGDGITYLVWLRDGNFLAHHLLYLPDLWLWTKAVAVLGIDQRTGAFLFSALCAALGNALLYLLLARSQKLAPGCTCPLRLTALIGLSPVLLFFATTVENHAHHYLWFCLLLLAVDRALARETVRTWLWAGLALLGAYGSHSSCLLILPALLALIQRLRGARLFRPTVAQLTRLAVFVLPTLAGKLAEPWIQADVLGGGPAWHGQAQLQFMLSILQPRNASAWIDYVWAEVFLPAPGLWWAFLILALRRVRPHAGDLLIAGLALAPYLLVFGQWVAPGGTGVREFGAYYLAFFALLLLLLGRWKPDLRPEEGVVLALLVLAQGVWGSWRTWTWVERQECPDWRVAAEAVDAAGAGGTVVFWRGGPAFHVNYDHPAVDAVPVELWVELNRGEFSLNPGHFELLARGEWTRLLSVWTERKGALVVSKALVERLMRDKSQLRGQELPLRPLYDALFASYRLIELEAGGFPGYRVEPK